MIQGRLLICQRAVSRGAWIAWKGLVKKDRGQ